MLLLVKMFRIRDKIVKELHQEGDHLLSIRKELLFLQKIWGLFIIKE